MDYSPTMSMTQQPPQHNIQATPVGPNGSPTPIKLEGRSFIKLEAPDYSTLNLVDPDFEPQTRARSNTWPQPRPEEPCTPHGVQPPQDQEGMGAGLLGFQKKSTSRRNAWGNMSYADLITQAIQSSPDKRLTLSQIYDWMVTNVSYFKDKGDSNSSAGWKNSIRHNLSLHNRFMRVQNEGTGKSSWWMLNPDAKPGKAARRQRATSMETSKYEKKRGRIKKKIEAMRNGGSILDTPSPSSSLSEGLDLFPDSPHQQVHNFNLSPSDFRQRTNSNASSCGGRLSPILGEVGVDHHHDSSQAPPLSSWDYGNYAAYGSPGHGLVGSDRFGTEQLAIGLASTVKLQESGVGSYDFHGQSYQSPQGFAGGNIQQNGGFRRPPLGIPATIKSERGTHSVDAHLLNGIYGTTFLGTQPSFLSNSNNHHLLQHVESKALSSIHHTNADLDFNVDVDAHPFECNVDEVLRSEPGILRDDFDDFGGPNSGASNLMQQPPTAVTMPCSPAIAPGSPFQSTVHHHHQPQSNGRQWTSVLH